jgi:hypothetical protein
MLPKNLCRFDLVVYLFLDFPQTTSFNIAMNSITSIEYFGIGQVKKDTPASIESNLGHIGNIK